MPLVKLYCRLSLFTWFRGREVVGLYCYREVTEQIVKTTLAK